MAKEPGTEQASADSQEVAVAPEPAAEPAADSAQAAWEQAPGEVIRHTDADRWAASFASVAGQQATGGPEQPDPESTQEVQLPGDRPSWSMPTPTPEPQDAPTWRNAGSASGWGQASSEPHQGLSHEEPLAPAWTTDVPSGFSWSSNTSAPTISPRPQVSPGGHRQADSWVEVHGVDEPVPDHSLPSQGAFARTSQALPFNPPPPVPQPSPPASAPSYPEAGQSYAYPAFAGQYGQPDQAAGAQSRWAAEAAAPPSPANQAPQQWTQQPAQEQSWQPASQQPPTHHASAADLTSGSLVKAPAAVPRVGWRKMVHAVTGGTVNPGLSQAELLRRDLIERATAPVRGCHRIAIVSLKGGIGKTTTTAGLGLTLAEHRGDRVVALDANPDAGTLAERLTGQVDVTVRDLLDNVDSIRSFTDVSSFTSLAARLQVLASEQDPEMSEAFSEVEYRTVADVLARYFNIILTDSGTGLLHSAMSGTLAIADSLVVVGSPSVDGASRASKTLDWLIAHGHGELVSRAVAVISTVRPASKELDMIRLREHFQSRVRAVVEIPYDRHLVTGGIIDMAQLERATEHSFLELSAIVADGFRFPPLSRPDIPARPKN